MRRAERGSGRGGRKAAGFTLIEVLVAFVIATLVLGGTLRLFQLGLGHGERTAERARLTTHLGNLLASLESEIPIEEGRFEGVFDDGTLWAVDMVPIARAEPFEDAAEFSILYEIRLSTRSPGRRAGGSPAELSIVTRRARRVEAE